VARSEELKHSVSTVAVHKNPVDAGMVFDGRRSRNSFLFPEASIAHCWRKFQNAFCFILKPFPVCLRAEFRFGGRINDRNGKNTLFHFGTEPFENQLKSVLCLVP
jgi:hypothetical protein